MPHPPPASSTVTGRQVIAVSSLHAKPGHAKLVLQEVRIVMDRSRTEVGCLLFDVYQLADDPAQLFLHEVWESRDAWEAHASNLHTSRFRAAVNSYLERPIEIFEVRGIE